MGIGFSEYLIIGIVILILYGPKKLPEIGKALGKMVHEFKKSLHETQSNETQSNETAGSSAGSTAGSAAVQTPKEESKPQDNRRLPD